ncbi:tetratricopeptide repeat protein [Winogradskyella ursingii]|uniref:tetratricopeptide repeat protein n=1 Tax=Winogradskyella ursingii TaxID=2686079 RepID=UPI0015CC79A2|nr:tetratricopeptide repeat protein [Winogradskyella ursingii]
MKVLANIFVFVFCLFGFTQNNQLFEEGNALYNQEKYSEAIEKYKAILNSGEHSADLYFNLGNAHYRLNNIAPSIYNYEKALQLAPHDEDIKNNLSFAQNMTIDAISDVPKVGFSRIFNNVVNMASRDSWAIIAIVGVVLFVLLFLLYHFSYSTSRKRFAFVTSILSLLIGCMALALAFQKEQLQKKDNPAIVFVQESRVMTDPNKSSEEVFRLHEGTKVQVLESYNDWKKIQISDNSSGWISAQDIKLLNIF